MDTINKAMMLVHCMNGGVIMKFIKHPFSLNVFGGTPTNTSKSTTAYDMFCTIAEHKTLFTSRQIANADTACALYCTILGRPDKAKFLSNPGVSFFCTFWYCSSGILANHTCGRAA
jgi:hypothetical protein